MCLILFAWKQHPLYPLIIAANRDEYFNRPTDPLRPWQDNPDIIAGRDLESQGTWLGISKKHRLAAVTNFREPGFQMETPISRGLLVSDFLESSHTAPHYLQELEPQYPLYRGFNLLLWDGNGLYYSSNRHEQLLQLLPGIYGLSNHLLDTDWPKVVRGKTLLSQHIQQNNIQKDKLFNILFDQTLPDEQSVPQTGLTSDWEKALSTIYIDRDEYGTRASTIVLLNNNGDFSITEKSRNQLSEPLGTACYTYPTQ